METTVGQRLGFFLKCSKISQEDFAKSLKTSRTSISAIISGARPLSTGMMARILDGYPQLNKEWLENGTGEMTSNDQWLSSDLVPHFSSKVSAGYLGGDAVAITAQEAEYRERMPGFKMYDFTQDVEGDSMVPIFYDGDIVACRKLSDEHQLVPGKYYVVDTRGGALIKRYVSCTKGSILFASENADYPNPRIRKEDIFGMAEVVGSLQKNPVQARKYYEQQMRDYLRRIIESKESQPDVPIDDLIKQVLGK